jgi:hypothetical protein
MKNKLFLVALIVSPVFAHFLSITSAYADAIYDPATGTITLTSVLAGDGLVKLNLSMQRMSK